MRRRILVISAVLLVVIISAVGVIGWLSFAAVEESFQRDADICRLRHLEHYGTLIEEYRLKTGRCPLQGNADVPIYVHVANDWQRRIAQDGPPSPHELVPMADFVAELERGLGRTIKERYDPQFGSAGRPNFYIYMVNKDYYFFAVHLDQPFPFAKKVAEHYYKAEISNAANERNNASIPQQLFASLEFKNAIKGPLAKAGFFDDRETEYENFTKRE